jgi:hypothetical protein
LLLRHGRISPILAIPGRSRRDIGGKEAGLFLLIVLAIGAGAKGSRHISAKIKPAQRRTSRRERAWRGYIT